eukprot:SAG31_NODE_21152_length_556_cov_1.912473_1_plen_57_part_10
MIDHPRGLDLRVSDDEYTIFIYGTVVLADNTIDHLLTIRLESEVCIPAAPSLLTTSD